MCFETESTLLSERYLNAQLSALWKNAIDCIAQDRLYPAHSPGGIQAHGKSRFTRPLAQYSIPSGKKPEDASAPFYAEFNEPRIEWIHSEAVLFFLEIKTGHIDFNKGSEWVADKDL